MVETAELISCSRVRICCYSAVCILSPTADVVDSKWEPTSHSKEKKTVPQADFNSLQSLLLNLSGISVVIIFIADSFYLKVYKCLNLKKSVFFKQHFSLVEVL